MNKRQVVIIIVILLIIILLSVGGYFMWRSKNPKKESDAKLADEIDEIDDTPRPGGTSTLVNNDFPLKRGMRGNLVTNVQSKLNSNSVCLNSLKIAGASVPVADGVFGPITEKALKTCFGVTQVSKELYDSMMKAQPATTAPAQVIPVGGKIVAFSSTGGVNAYKSKTASASNLYKYYNNGYTIGTFLAKDGIFSKIISPENNTVVWVMTNQIKYIP